jgi:hypothetical protein
VHCQNFFVNFVRETLFSKSGDMPKNPKKMRAKARKDSAATEAQQVCHDCKFDLRVQSIVRFSRALYAMFLICDRFMNALRFLCWSH